MPSAINTNFAEQWQSTYDVLKKSISYKQFDYDQVKQVLISYLRTYHPEYFNNLIETDELLPLIELFAYVGELFAYRVDVNTQEHILKSATRKSSVLQLAGMLGYTPSRRQAATGLVKIDSLTTTESVLDHQGIDIKNKTIKWNDQSNPNWQLQFELIINKIVNNRTGILHDTDKLNLDGTIVEKFSLNTASQINGVYRYTLPVDKSQLAMELVPVQLTNDAISEHPASGDRSLDVLKLNDGFGVGSRNTGYFFLTKQGKLTATSLFLDGATVNQTVIIKQSAVNDTDVWLTEVNPNTGEYIRHWTRVDNIAYNSPSNDRNVFQVETLENDNVQLVFGDGNYANIPSGAFVLWMRSSESLSSAIPVSAIQKRVVVFEYNDLYQNRQQCTIQFSLTTPIENQSESESIQKIQRAAPGVFYTQDRMVNAQDHEGYILQDASIVKVKAVNRSFTGQSKYSGWNDSSEVYENVKVFGNDGVFYFEPTIKIKEVANPNNSLPVQVFALAHVEPLLAAPDLWLGIAQRIGTTPTIRTYLESTEKARLVSALQLLTSGGSVGLQWNQTTRSWAIGLNLPGQLDVTIDVITSHRGWVITSNTAATIFHSSTTKFWNYSLGSTIEYDTLLPTKDRITILKANVNRTGDGVLMSDLTFKVTGNVVQHTALPIQTTTDLTKLEIIGSDANADGFPEDISAESLLNSIFTKQITPNTSTDVELPVKYLRGFSDIISVIGNNGPLSWVEDPSATVGQLSNVVKVTNTGTNTRVTITLKDYVYLSRPNQNVEFTVQENTDSVRLNYAYDTANVLYKRLPGRKDLNFLWEHFSDSFNLIDPVRTNINDLYIITKSYYVDTLNWLQLDSPQPAPPTYFELKSAYSSYLRNAMMSDEVVLRPGKFKVLYGKNAPPQSRASIQLVVNDQSVSSDSVKSDVISLIRLYFDISNIGFGDELFFSSLATYVQTNSKYDIRSMLLVPLYPEFQFGDLYQITSAPDEVLIADVTASDIVIVDSISNTNLRQ